MFKLAEGYLNLPKQKGKFSNQCIFSQHRRDLPRKLTVNGEKHYQ